MAKKEVSKKETKNENKSKKSFFKGFKAELKKVSWPAPKQLVNSTIAVITIVLIISLIVVGLDQVFGFISVKGIDGIKEVLSQNVEEVTTENQEETVVTEDSNTTVETENTTTETVVE